jgi:hypothetical protein
MLTKPTNFLRNTEMPLKNYREAQGVDDVHGFHPPMQLDREQMARRDN